MEETRPPSPDDDRHVRAHPGEARGLAPPGVGIAELGAAELSLYLNAVPPDSWKLHRTIINGFLEWAINYDHRSAKNPIKLLPKMEAGPRRTTVVFSEQEIDAIVGAARYMDDPVRDHARAILMIDTGCRKAEMRMLRHRDIDPAGKVIKVVGKGDKEREIPVYGEFWLAYERSLFEPIPRLERFPEPDDFFWFPMRVAGEYGKRERQVTKAYPETPMSTPLLPPVVGPADRPLRRRVPQAPHHEAHVRDRRVGSERGRHPRREGAARARVGVDDRAVPPLGEEGEGRHRAEARRGPPPGTRGSPLVTTSYPQARKEAYRRLGNPAWLLTSRRLADSNCCYRHKARKAYFPAQGRF